MIDPPRRETPPTLVTALKGTCPRCGKGKLFKGFLTIAPGCTECGLDYGFSDAGDGPVAFITLFAGFIVVLAAVIVEIAYQPPYWVHLVLWVPIAAVVTLGMMRPTKAWLIAQQYRYAAAEGQLRDK